MLSGRSKKEKEKITNWAQNKSAAENGKKTSTLTTKGMHCYEKAKMQTQTNLNLLLIVSFGRLHLLRIIKYGNTRS